VPTIDGETASSMMVNHNKRGIALDLKVEGGNRVKTLGLPVKFSGTPRSVRTGAPIYGQHTREVLEQQGFSPQRSMRSPPRARSCSASSKRGPDACSNRCAATTSSNSPVAFS
jgi:crotonobetainyl-CoA:carnitine CoA-transferase CaiB-like acyl-CoA transferase